MNKNLLIRFVDNLMDNATPEYPVWNQEVILGHIKPGWNYIDGCMLKALLDVYDATGEKKYWDFTDNYVDFFVRNDGSILGYSKEDYNSDSINEGKVLFKLLASSRKEKYKRALDLLYSQLESHPRTTHGNFWHKQIYPNQVWLDGLYMTLPFYAEYDRRFNKSTNIKDIGMQFQQVFNNMRENESGLLFHGIDEARTQTWADPATGLSKNFWSRSIGWLVMALLDTAEQIDEQLFTEKETLIVYLRETLDALLATADVETGLLWQVTDQGNKSGNYLETSSSCAFAYALMKGARMGFLPEYYFDKGKRVFDSIVRHKLKEAEGNLILYDICLVAGLGGFPGRGDYKERDGSYEYYISEPRVDNDAKGVAPFLMAFAEILHKDDE